MIPIRDTIESRNYPVVNISLIIINVILFLVEMGQGEQMGRFIFTYGLVPARFSVPEISAYFTPAQQIFSLLSFMFLHGGFWHLLGNMWSLYIFGDNVEDRLGSLRYLLFYLACGWASGLSHLILNWHSQVPTIGASGAIAGVMGAYFVLYPGARILTLIPIFIIPYFIEIPAFFFLGIWFLLQFLSAAGTYGHGSGIAWWAHVGGFLSGILFLKLMLNLPQLGITKMLRHTTFRRKTPRIQLIRPTSSAEDPNLYGDISITPHEAHSGTKKMVNIPWKLQKRLFLVSIPPGVRSGTRLRLVGLGKKMNGSRKGDLYLDVHVGSWD
jgi:membrane associated rhomboid family serine protease